MQLFCHLAVGLVTLLLGVNGQGIERCVVDIGLVIDMSGSIQDTGEANWGLQMDFIKRLVSELEVGKDLTRVGAVTFGNRAELHFKLNTYDTKDEILAAIDRIPYRGGNTNTTGGLRVARDEIFSPSGGDRPDIMNLVLLITDGNPTREEDALPGVAADIRRRGMRIIGVGVTNSINQQVFRDIVTQPFGENYFNVSDFSSLMSILEAVIFASCRTMPPTPAPAPTAPPAGVCASLVDVVFIVDSSGSIGDRNFEEIRAFITDLIMDLDVDNGRVRVALMTFSDNVQVRFNLNQFLARTDMMQNVVNMPYTRGRTNTGPAIRTARELMFRSENGARNEATKVVVIVTDGASNNKEETLREAFQSKEENIHTIVVAVGGWIDNEELIGMASYPYEKNAFTVESTAALQGIKNQLRDIICNNVNECLSNPCRNGATCVNGIDSYMCLCPTTFSGINCERRCILSSDIVFAMDASGSIRKENFQREVDFVKSLMHGLNLNTDTRVGLLTFSNNAVAKFYLNSFTSQEAIMNAMSFYYEGGTTDTAGALNMMRQDFFTSGRGDRQDRPNIGIVITDGRSNDDRATWEAAMAARDAGIHLIAIGVGSGVRDIELRGIASDPVERNIFRVNSFEEILNSRENILRSLCNDVNECDSNPCRNGGQCFDLIGGYQCRCRDGFTGLNCEKGCDGKLDLVFAIDSSGSIRNERFPFVLDFVEKIIEPLEVSAGRTRIGVLKWSDNAQVEFQLNRYTNRQDVLQHVRRIAFTGGRTHTASAIQRMTDEMFTSAAGDRQDVQDIVIIVTDGNSNINAQNTIPFAIEMRMRGAHVIVVAIGTFLNQLELRGIASSPDSANLFTVDSYRDLTGIQSRLVGATCNDVNECDSNPCQNGGQCVDGFRSYYCLCAADWTGERCTRQCRRQWDVAIVLDLSGSTDEVYDISIALTKEIVEGLPVRFNRARIGLVSYADRPTVNFYLDTYQTKEEILNAIAFRIAGGKTNTQAAISEATDRVFNSGRGDRTGVNNAMIVITDGGSNMQREATILQADRARSRDIEIFVAAISATPDLAEVNGIASDPDSEHVVRVNTASDVPAAASTLLNQLCQ